jgi:hypothetical protein
MFASIDLARRIDGAEARLTESLGRAAVAADPESGSFVERIGGGVVAYTGPSSPMNKMIGVGFDGVPPEDQLRRIEEKFGERGAPLQAEVSTLADPAFVVHLTTHGYVLQNFENVSGRLLTNSDADARPGDIEIGVDDDTAAVWLDAAIVGFLHLDGKGVPGEELPPREAMESSLKPFAAVKEFRRYFARIGGRVAGVAAAGRRRRAVMRRRDDSGVSAPRRPGRAAPPSPRRRSARGLRSRRADGAAGIDLAGEWPPSGIRAAVSAGCVGESCQRQFPGPLCIRRIPSRRFCNVTSDPTNKSCGYWL